MSEKTMAEQRCETCRFWSLIDPIEDPKKDPHAWGACRRYPPAMSSELPDINGDDWQVGYHPTTFPGDWCGEWQARESREPEPAKCVGCGREFQPGEEMYLDIEGEHWHPQCRKTG